MNPAANAQDNKCLPYSDPDFGKKKLEECLPPSREPNIDSKKVTDMERVPANINNFTTTVGTDDNDTADKSNTQDQKKFGRYSPSKPE